MTHRLICGPDDRRVTIEHPINAALPMHKRSVFLKLVQAKMTGSDALWRGYSFRAVERLLRRLATVVTIRMPMMTDSEKLVSICGRPWIG